MEPLTDIFKALADPTRLRLVDLLATHDLCVGALADRLNISKPAVSQHLQILRKAGLVKGEKRGYWTHYFIERPALDRLATAIKRKADSNPFPREVCRKTLPALTPQHNERRNVTMCNDCCEQPEKLKGKPEDCTPEQIRECHGDTQTHPCTTEKK